MRLSVRARAQNALFRRARFSSPAQTRSHLTQRRILHRPPHGKPHSATGNSRKSAVCTHRLTEKRSLHPPAHGKARSAPATPPRRDREAHSGRETSRKGAFCMRAVVASRGHFRRSAYTPAYPRLPARATGRGHGSHDIEGPMAPVMPKRSDLRPMPPGR